MVSGKSRNALRLIVEQRQERSLDVPHGSERCYSDVLEIEGKNWLAASSDAAQNRHRLGWHFHLRVARSIGAQGRRGRGSAALVDDRQLIGAMG